MSPPVLVVDSVAKSFGSIAAVSDVSLAVAEGETVGIVGESGSGKSTLARLVLRLIEPDRGTIQFCGEDLLGLSRRALRRARADLQFVPQHPRSSLNPRATVASSIKFVLRAHGLPRQEHAGRVEGLLEQVGLSARLADRYPHELSGGQLQRVAIARAIATSPRLVVCDEPVSALDKSVQAQVLNLLARLRAETKIALLFISHDLSVVEHIADQVLVMNAGEVVERGSASELWQRPAHPYTKSLIDAIPGRRVLESAANTPAAVAPPRASPITGGR